MRRRASVLVAVGLVLAAGACDWSLPRFDPARTADNPDSGLSTGNVSGLRLAWAKPGGAFGAPLEANGIVVSTGLSSATATTAFSASDGSVRWTAPSNFVPGAIDGNSVYGTVESSMAGETFFNLTALSLDTGAVQWSALTGGSIVTNAVNGRIYVTGCTCAHGEGPVLEAWDAATHKIAWGTSYLNAQTAVGPAVANGIVYAVATSVVVPYGLTLFAYDERTGKQLWSRLLRQDCGATNPVVSNGDVFTTGGTYDAKNGALVTAWPVCTASDPVVVGTTVFAVIQDSTNVTLVSFNGASGASYWATQIGSTPTTDPLRAPAVGNDAVFVSNTQGVIAYDMGTGKPLWFAGGVSGPLHDPVIANGTVYAGTNMTLYAWRVPS
jgi:hypothetical protein